MPWFTIRFLLLGCLLFTHVALPASRIYGQDDSDAATEKDDKDAAAPSADDEDNSAATEKEPADPKEIAAANDAFAETLDQWKAVLKDLRSLRLDFQSADTGEATSIQTKWDKKIAEGEALIDVLRERGAKAYALAPNSDPQLTRFLLKLAEDDVAHERYEQARKVTDLLVDNNCGISQIYDLAGIACFATNEFERAEEFLIEAEERAVISSEKGTPMQGVVYLQVVGEHQELWKEEQRIREAEAKADDLPRVKLTTSQGEMIIELFENEAPDTVGNFVHLVEDGFYDGKVFHRVLPGFMAQGGCPRGDGTGDAGYNIYCECIKEDYRRHFRGTLSMAKGSLPDTGSSQFFMCFVPAPHLNGAHTAFGRIIKGLDVLAKIQRVDPTKPSPGPLDKIVKAEVVRKRDHEYKPNKVR